MKKILTSGISKFFLLFLLSICLCACGGDNSTTSNESSSTTSENVTTSETTTSENTTDKIPSNITEDGNNGYGPYYRR